MKSTPFFQKENSERTNLLPSFTKKFEETSINNEIDQNYTKILEILEVSSFL